MDGFLIQSVGKFTVVEFFDVSLMDPLKLEPMGQQLYHLVDAEDRRRLVLDFARVQFISSQFVGVLMALNRKLAALPSSKLILCSIHPRLAELLRITRLDKLLTIKPSQKEAVQE